MASARRPGPGQCFKGREFMSSKRIGAALFAAASLFAVQAHASTVVFSDDFNDNDVSDWTFSTNYGGTAGVDTGGVLGPYIDAPPGGIDLVARATRTLTLLAGLYTLDLDAFSVPCSGCTISYDVLFDGASLTRTATGGAWEHRQFDLGALTAGSHTITLGMHTTNASSGHFLAKFDNVALTGDRLVAGGVPEPSAWSLMILGFGGAGALLRRRGGGARTVPAA